MARHRRRFTPVQQSAFALALLLRPSLLLHPPTQSAPPFAHPQKPSQGGRMTPTYRPVSALVLFLGTALLLGCDGDRATAPETVDRPTLATGLPANPSTKEYKFNLIGVPRDKTPS